MDLFSGKAPKTMRLLQTGQAFYDQEILLSGKSGKIHATASGIPIFDEDQQVIGATIILRPIARVQELVNRFTGAQATFTFDSIIGEDKALRRAVKLAMKAGTNNSTVLLQAESGTGKEVFAQAIHNISARSNGPFVAINCAALPRNWWAANHSAMWKGLYRCQARGARASSNWPITVHFCWMRSVICLLNSKPSCCGLAGKSHPAWGDTPIKVDVRIIAATNHNLPELVAQEGSGRISTTA